MDSPENLPPQTANQNHHDDHPKSNYMLRTPTTPITPTRT